MAREVSLEQACQQIEAALKKYARSKGWRKTDYILVVHPSEWDSVHILLAAKAFRDEEGFAVRDKELLDHLTRVVGREVRNRIGLLQTMSLAKYESLDLAGLMLETFKAVDRQAKL